MQESLFGFGILYQPAKLTIKFVEFRSLILVILFNFYHDVNR